MLDESSGAGHRDETAQAIRRLIDKIVLTPSEDERGLVVDLYGDLAGILQIVEEKRRGNGRKPSVSVRKDRCQNPAS